MVRDVPYGFLGLQYTMGRWDGPVCGSEVQDSLENVQCQTLGGVGGGEGALMDVVWSTTYWSMFLFDPLYFSPSGQTLSV